MSQIKNKLFCEQSDCRGGKAYKIREKLFCSPSCGNKHFDLNQEDDDYWPDVYDDNDKSPETPKINYGDIAVEARMYANVENLYSQYEYYYNKYHNTF